MKNYLERVPYIFSLHQEEVLDLSEDSLSVSPEGINYLEKDMTMDQSKDDCLDDEKIDKADDNESTLQVYSMEDVSCHDSFDDCWIILYDKVYDISRFLQEHPGGEDVLLEYAGRDATISFRSVGHSSAALKALDEYLIGILPDRQRLFPSDSETRWSFI